MANGSENNSELKREHSGRHLRVFALIRFRFMAWRLNLSPLAIEVGRLAEWLDQEVFPAIVKEGKDSVGLDVTERRSISPHGTAKDVLEAPEDFSRSAVFFSELGIHSLELDARLEANQIEDLFVLLYAHRKKIVHRRTGVPKRGIAAHLLSEDGADVSYMRVCIVGNTLRVKYHYCLTPFSRFVLWFEHRNRNFSDHRALFQSAPRYGILVAVVTLIPLGIYLANGNRLLLVIISLMASASLFTMVYSFFMIVGSLEYDNEEKAHKLNRANHQLRQAAKKIREDLLRAKTVQEKMLPDSFRMPMHKSVEWTYSFVPETEIGGDYFDVAELTPDSCAVVFADVSGHGMSAAFITAVLKMAFQGWVEEKYSLEEFVARLNQRLVQLTPEDSFAAVFAGVFNSRTGEFTYFNGGHSPEPLILYGDRSQNVSYLDQARGMILGIMDEIDVEVATQELAPGDRVFMVTDGIVEAWNKNGEMYGATQLERLLNQHRDRSIKEVVDEIIADVGRFTGETEQDDDQTILAFGLRAEAASDALYPSTDSMHAGSRTEPKPQAGTS